MIQIFAAGIVALRVWLEQHIAKREKAGAQRITFVEAGKNTRRGSIATFGFGPLRSNAPAPLDLDFKGSAFETRAITGSGAEKISTPFNVRKAGADGATGLSFPRQVNRQPSTESAELRDNPFLSPDQQRDLDKRVYPQTADYQYNYTSAVDDNDDYYDVPGGYQPQNITLRSGRASSELLNPMDSPLPRGGDSKVSDYVAPRRGDGSPPKTQGVTMADLFPPPPEPQMDPQMNLTAKSVSSSYSRPFSERRGPGNG